MTTKKNARRLDALRTLRSNDGAGQGDVGIAEPRVDETPSVKRKKPLEIRTASLGELSSGKREVKTHLRVDPTTVRLWAGHNRDYDLLSPERCADLIDGFKRVGRQEFPAIVRRVDGEGDQYELICGARRHWTASYLGWDLLIEVRDLKDRDAFILQDIENRDREDVSDYERACDYTKALPLYFDNNKRSMAEFLQIDPSNFNRLLELSELPPVVIKAYGDIRDLKVHHGQQFQKWFEDAKAKKVVERELSAMAGQGIEGRKVISTIKRALSGSTPRRKATATRKEYGSLTVLQDAEKGTLSISARLPVEMTDDVKQQMRDDFDAMLQGL